MSQIDDFLKNPLPSDGKSGPDGGKPVSDEINAFLRKRTTGEAFKDVGIGLVQGAAGLVKSAGDAYGLATGDMNNAVSKTADGWQEDLEKQKSAGFQARAQQRKANIDAQDSTLGKAWSAVKDTVTDPALALDTVATNISTLIPGAAAGRAVAAARMAQAARAGLTGESAALAAKQAGTYGTRAMVGTGAAQQATDVSAQAYEDNIKKDDAAWDANPAFQAALAANGGDRAAAKHALSLDAARAAFLPAAGISVGANAIPGGAMLEKALVGGAAREAAKEGAKFAIPKAIAKGALGEAAGEAIEEGGGQYAANVAAQHYIDPNQDLMNGVGENAGLGAAGGLLLGGAGGAFHGHRPAAAKPGQPDADPAAPPAADPQQPGGSPLLLGNQPPEQMVSFPDGTVGRTGEVESYLANLPEDQRAEARARLMGQSITEVNAPRKPSEEMGLRSGPDAGALESIAAMAVDNGAHGQMQQAAAQAQAQEQAAEAGTEATPKAQPAAEAPSEQPRAQEQHAVDPDTGEIAGMPTVSDWSDGQLSDAYRTAQEPEVRRQLAAELVRRRANREEEALQAELRDEQASAAMQHVPDSAFAGVREDAGEVPKNIEVQGGSHAAAEAASEALAPGSKAQGVNVATLMQLNRKQLPDMSEGELQQLASMLPAEHKRQAKIQAELLARGQQAQPAINQGATTDGTQTDQAEQGSAQPAQAGRAQAAQAVQPVAARADAGADANPASAGASAASLGAGQADGAVQPAAGGRRNVGDQSAKGLIDGAAATQDNGRQANTTSAPQAAAPADERQARAQRIADAGAQWTRMPAAERSALVGRLEGVKPVLAKNLPRAQWESLNGDIQGKLADALEPETRVAGPVGVEGSKGSDGTRAATQPEALAGQKNQVRYRDPETGMAWTGRGKPPAWIEGKDYSKFEASSATDADAPAVLPDEGSTDKPPPKSVPQRMREAKAAKAAAASAPATKGMTQVQQGVWENRNRQKQEAWEKVKRLREGVKNGTANRLQLLQAESAHRQLVRDVEALQPAQAEVLPTKDSSPRKARFSQGLVSPPTAGPKPGAQRIQRLVDQVQQLSKSELPIAVVGSPSDVPGIEAPIGTNPSGALADGRIYLFADNIRSIGEAYVTLFHEVFHLGLQKVIPAEDYAALLKDFARNPLVQKFMRQWKDSAEGRQRAAQMPSAAYEALAAEEALAMVSEELAADEGMGSRAPGLVKRMLSWFANVADRLGLPGSFGDWVRGLSRTQAEQFVSDMTRAVLGGELNLARTRAKYGTQIEALSQQNRMRQGELATVADEADSGDNAANFEGTAKPRRPASAQDKAVMEAIASGKSARDVLRLVAGQSKDPFLRNVARMLLKSGITPNIEFGHIGKTKDGKPIHGQYRGKTDTIAMAGSAEYAAERIFMHEAMHAATMRALSKPGLARQQLLKLLEHVRKQPSLAGFYGITDRPGQVDEFVAEVFTNPAFQVALRNISAPANGGTIKTAWDGFVRILRSILGLPNDANNALSQALDLGVAALRQDMLLRKQGTESKGRANMVTGRAIAPVELTLKGWSGTASELSALAREVYSQELQGTTERNDSMGVEIAFTSEGKGEAFGARGKLRHPERAELVRVLRELVRDAVKVAEAAPGKGREVDSLAFHTLVAPLAINGQMHAVRLTVREARHTPKGAAAHKFYDVAQVKIERSPDADGVASSISAGPVHPGTVGTSAVSVSDLAQALKIDGYEAGGDDGADVANFGADDFTQFKNSAIDQLNAAFKHEGKVSVWDKTVGTMRNLAERAKAFKPVYETAQRTIDDVSMLANDAADMAPSLLPRVESLADLKKKPVSAEDNKAVAKPLFEGTLMWARDVDGTAVLSDDLIAKYAGLTPDQKAELLVRAGKLDEKMLRAWRGMPAAQFAAAINSRFQNQLLKSGVVWSDDELKTKFKATPEQIRLYHEARSAIDRSIDMTARADMLRLLGEDYAPMRDAVLDQPDMESAAKLLTDMLEQEAKDVPDKAERIGELVQQLDKRLATAADLQARGYAPLSRFGRYTVDVVDKSGERLYFGMYESQRESNLAKLKLAQGFPGAKITQGTMSAEAYKLFAGMTPETAEQFGAMLGLNKDGDTAQDQAYQEYLKLAQNNHSALKRMIHRKGIAGYSEDVGRVIANFVYSNARAGSMGLNAGQLEKAIEAIPKEQGELRDVAVKLRDYIRDPQEEGQAIRGMLFAQYLGGSVASALVNMTQPFQITMPWLSQYGGMAKAGKQMARALKDMGTKGFQYEADLAKALKAAEDDGTVSPQEVHQLMAQARGAGALRSGDGTKAGNARAAAANTWERTKVAWGQPFALAEQFNRRTTFIAAYRIAKDQGMADPAEFARKAVLETQFVYSKANKPRWARGAVGGTLFCVDDTTEALTQRGWIGPDDLKPGDMLASFDMKTERLIWAPMQSVHVFDHDGEMVHARSKTLDMLMTPDHRVVHYKSKRTKGAKRGTTHWELGVAEAQDIPVSHRVQIPTAAPFDHAPVGEQLADAMVRVIGWVVTEGWFQKKNRGREAWGGALKIYQNEGRTADLIRADLRDAGLEFTETSWDYEGGNARHIRFNVKKSSCTELRSLLPGKQLTPALLMRMTTRQIEQLVDRMIEGDGSEAPTGNRCFIQNPGQTLETFQMALTILGKSFRVVKHGPACRNVLIREPAITANGRYSVKTSERVHYKGRVWCPIVPGTSTWVARRNGMPFITHNTFKTYSVSYLELMHRMWTQGGPEGKRAVGWAIAMLMLMSGAGGLPFLEDAEDLIDGAGQMMGYNISTKQWRKELLAGVVGKELGEFMEQGISGLPGAPVDVSGRLGMGNLIPGTGLFLNKPNRERDLLEVAGPAGDLVKRGFTGARKALSGDVAGAAMEVSPTAVRNVAKGADMARTGMYRDTKGYKVIDSTLDEALFKAIGFQPKPVSEVQESNSYMLRAKSFYQQTSADIKAQWAQALFEKDDAALERVRERLATWNKQNPEQPIVVKIPDVMKRVREMNKDRTARIADTAPKALRERLREVAREANAR
ncbi:PLxRFG domain-containing protein [Comamonas sp. J-3]|uniref:PLxRFG domain-containing protein n=1 Tax=Comamonas trifloxystrobinivorans TaxID=3350256 RepID=UPI00372A0ED7